MEENKSCQSCRLRVHVHFRFPCTVSKHNNHTCGVLLSSYNPSPLSGTLGGQNMSTCRCFLFLFFFLHKVRTFDFLSSFTLAKQRRVQCAPREREVLSSIPDLARSVYLM